MRADTDLWDEPILFSDDWLLGMDDIMAAVCVASIGASESETSTLSLTIYITEAHQHTDCVQHQSSAKLNSINVVWWPRQIIPKVHTVIASILQLDYMYITLRTIHC